MLNPPTQVRTTNRRYLLHDELGQGGMGIVYRATDRLTGQQVALKKVTTPAQYLEFASRIDSDSFSLRLALAREFKIMASLRHPNIISVLDYGFDDEQQPFFTMNLLEDGETFLSAAHPQPFETQIDLVIQTLRALAYLHRRGILHRDLKPGNILVTNGQVQVLDFGLAAQRGIQGTSGTLNYMAPEILYDEPVSESSDLYAVGVMAYELFAGRHPFADAANATELITHIFETTPDVSALPISFDLQNVIARLLEKQAGNRYATADDVIAAINDALDGPQVAYETAATRESFLQAAEFVGRSSELEVLSDALSQTIDSMGSAWLVGGESGVGKSRLLDELRTQALVSGILVLRGQAIAEGGASYQMWRPVLRYLCLTTDLTALEASVLKALIPDIDMLVGWNVTAAPDLDPQSTIKRFLTTIENILLRQTQPLLILLEDLHWAGHDSLLLLRHLSGLTRHKAFMLLANYRDDERPTLAAELPGMTLIKLARLHSEDIAQLSESMLGEAGKQPGVVELLQRETEGNIFFIIEVVRALAQKAGQLRSIADETLPKSVFTGGVRDVLQRRLARIPREVYPLLQLSAVAGRQLDPNVLRVVYPNLSQWLTVCADAAVLDVSENRWQFAHDKLREAILRDLSPAAQRDLHGQVARAIEQAYPNTREHAALLAYHWNAAGDEEREVQYLKIVGEQSLRLGSNQEAIRALSRVLEVRQHADSQEKAHLTRLLAEAHVGLGDMVNATKTFKAAAALLEAPYPARPPLALLSQLVVQIAHRLRMPHKVKTAEEAARHTEIVSIYGQLAELAFHANDTVNTIYGALRAMNAAEQTDLSIDRAVIYANMCITAGFIPLHGLARSYRANAIHTLEQLPANDQAKAEAYVRLALYAQGTCDWETFMPTATECRALCEKIGDARRWGEITNLLGHAAFDRGDYPRSIDLYEQLYASAVKNKNAVHQGWALVNLAMCSMRLDGSPAEALETLKRAIVFTEQTHNHLTTMNCLGLMALAYYRMGEFEQARSHADRALALAVSRPTSPSNFEGYAEIPGIYLALWEAGDPSCAANARQAIKNLGSFAKLFYNGRPRLHLYQGIRARIKGKADKAQAEWKKAAEIARQIGMPYEEHLAMAELERRTGTVKSELILEAESVK